MSMIFTILKKDLRQHRLVLGSWLVLLLFSTVSAVLSGQSPLSRPGAMSLFELRDLLPIFGRFMSFTSILAVVAIGQIVQSDSCLCTGTTPFWMTRPISRRDLLLAKLVLILGLFVLVPTLGEMAVLVSHGMPYSFLPRAFFEIALDHSWFVLALMLFAALNTNQSRYFITLVAFAVFGTLFLGSLVIAPLNMPRGGSDAAFALLSLQSFVLLVSLVVLVHEYDRRRTKTSLKLFFFALPVAIWLNFGTGGMGRVFFLDPDLGAHLGGTQNWSLEINSAAGYKETSTKDGTVSIFAPVVVRGVTNEIVPIIWKISDGKLVAGATSIQGNPTVVPRGETLGERLDSSVKALFPGSEIIGEGEVKGAIELIELHEKDFDVIKGMDATFSANVEGRGVRYSPAGEVSAQPDQMAITPEERFSLQSIGPAEFRLDEAHWHFLSLPEEASYRADDFTSNHFPQVYALVNESKKQIIIPRPAERWKCRANAVTPRLNRRSCEYNIFHALIDEAWLKEARLIRYNTQIAGWFAFNTSGNELRVPQ